MSLTRKILRGSTLNLVDHAARILAMLVVTPLMVAKLGLEGYGIWLVLTAAVSFLNLLDGGITLSGTRYLARALGGKDAEAAGLVTGTLRWLYRRIGLGCAVATAGLVLAVPWLVRDAAWQESARLVLLALGGGMTLRFFLRIHLVILKGHLRYDLIVAASLVKVVLQTALVLALLTRGHGLVVLAVAQIISDLFDQLLVVFFSRRTGGGAHARAGHSPELLPEILRYSALAFLNTTGQHLRSRIDPFVITNFVGVAAVPVYNMGLRLATLFADMVNAVMGGTLLAGFSQVEGRDGLDGVRRKFLFSLRFSIPLALLGAAGLAVLGPAFLLRWVGPDFADSGTVLRLLVPPYALWLMQFPSGSLFLSLNRHNLITKLTFGAGLFNVALSVTLASWMGFYGVVWATFVDMTLFYGLAVPLLVSRVLGMPLMRYYAVLITPVLKLGLALGAAALLAQPLVKPDYLSLLMAGMALGAAFGAACWWLLMHRDERAVILRKLRPASEVKKAA